MKTLTLEGRYVTSNRYAESVFGDYKAREIKNTGATQSTLAELTISKMNNTQSFLRAMSNEARSKLWEEIDGKTALTDFKKTRKQEAEKAARKQAREDRKIAGIKIEAEKKKAGEKRRYQENNSTIKPRKKLPKRKTAN
jgi:hypothetical protein